jgi:hypothetical protein
LVDERAEDLLPGDARQPESVGRLSLPDVEAAVLGSREVNGPSGPPLPRLPDGGEPFGLVGCVQRGGRRTGWRTGAEPFGAGVEAVGGMAHEADLPLARTGRGQFIKRCISCGPTGTAPSRFPFYPETIFSAFTD